MISILTMLDRSCVLHLNKLTFCEFQGLLVVADYKKNVLFGMHSISSFGHCVFFRLIFAGSFPHLWIWNDQSFHPRSSPSTTHLDSLISHWLHHHATKKDKWTKLWIIPLTLILLMYLNLLLQHAYINTYLELERIFIIRTWCIIYERFCLANEWTIID